MIRDESQPWGTGVPRDIAPPPPLSFSRRFFGGPPLAVLLRLLFVSLVVGAVLMWLRLEPMDVLREAVRAGERLWALGYGALGQIGSYVLAGAVIVVPIWFVVRLLTLGRVR